MSSSRSEASSSKMIGLTFKKIDRLWTCPESPKDKFKLQHVATRKNHNYKYSSWSTFENQKIPTTTAIIQTPLNS